MDDGPIPAIHGVERCRLIDLVGWIYNAYGVSLDPSRLGRIGGVSDIVFAVMHLLGLDFEPSSPSPAARDIRRTPPFSAGNSQPLTTRT